LDAAYAAFQENVTGSIATGKYADFILLSADILDENAVAAEKLHAVECLTTYFGGEVIFDRSASKDSDNTALIAGVLLAVAGCAGLAMGIFLGRKNKQEMTDTDEPLLQSEKAKEF
jgi:hypothetical protein